MTIDMNDLRDITYDIEALHRVIRDIPESVIAAVNEKRSPDFSQFR